MTQICNIKFDTLFKKEKNKLIKFWKLVLQNWKVRFKFCQKQFGQNNLVFKYIRKFCNMYEKCLSHSDVVVPMGHRTSGCIL